ncbi:MAG: NUDIX hydrolase [Chloroflexota bacterium]
MPLTPWKILESTYIRPRIREDKVELPNGNLFDAMVFEFRRWANVVALTPEREVVLIRQYRHGVQKLVWEFPGGVVEDGETALAGAQRELLEESGYTASDFIQVGAFHPNPASLSNALYAFLATDARRVAAQRLDEAEQIEVHLFPLDEVVTMAKRGEIDNALQIAVLFHVLAHLNRIA